MDLPLCVQTSNPNLQHELQEAGRGSVGSAHRLRNVLVISEMALAVVLLVGAGLMLKSLHRVLEHRPRFQHSQSAYRCCGVAGEQISRRAQTAGFSAATAERIRSLPGVRQAGAVRLCRCPARGNTSRFDLEGHPKNSGGQEYEANTPTVSQNYFSRDGYSASRREILQLAGPRQIDSRGRRQPGHGGHGFSQPGCRSASASTSLTQTSRTMSRLWAWWQTKMLTAWTLRRLPSCTTATNRTRAHISAWWSARRGAGFPCRRGYAGRSRA